MKRVRSSGAATFAMLLILAGLKAVNAVAQDGTPATDECRATTAQENVAIVRAYYDAQQALATNPGAADIIHDLLHDNYLTSLDRSATGVAHDPASNQDELAVIGFLHETFPGWTHTIDEIFSADGRVAVVRTITASRLSVNGEATALAPPISFQGVHIFTIECGLMVEAHSVFDETTASAEIGSRLGAEAGEG